MYASFIFFLLFFSWIATAEAAISCAEYTHHMRYSKLNEIIPYGIPEEEHCKLIPKNCGESWLFFNPKGGETYYYKSACYHHLAIRTLEEKYCDLVIERHSIFLDGSYYSPDACRKEIRIIKADAAAPKVDATNIHRINQMSVVTKNGEWIVTLSLSDASIDGEYALSVSARYHDNGRDIWPSLNPNGPDIRYDKSFARFHPVNNWIIPIQSSQKNITFTISQKTFLAVAKAAETQEVPLEVQLQFIRSDRGELADQENRKNYISKHTVILRP